MFTRSEEELNLRSPAGDASSKCKISTWQQSNVPALNQSSVKVNITIPRGVQKVDAVLVPQGQVLFNLSNGSIICEGKPMNLALANLHAMAIE